MGYLDPKVGDAITGHNYTQLVYYVVKVHENGFVDAILFKETEDPYLLEYTFPFDEGHYKILPNE